VPQDIALKKDTKYPALKLYSSEENKHVKAVVARNGGNPPPTFYLVGKWPRQSHPSMSKRDKRTTWQAHEPQRGKKEV
jgi:hypothetical protein